MKRKDIFIIVCFSSVLLILLGVIISVIPEEKDKHEIVYFDDYQFEINEKYNYKFLKDKDYGVLENEKFLSSFIYIADEEYSSLISRTSSYTNMNSDELDSVIEEKLFGVEDGFTNIKKVYYEDVQKEYYLVVILIKLTEEETFVFQYELEDDDDSVDIIEDIEAGLKKFEKKL